MVHDTVVWASRHGELIYVQKTIEQLVGWTVGDILAKPSLGIIPPDQTTGQKLAHPSIHTYQYTTELLHKDGTPVTVCNCVVILKDDGLTVGLIRRTCPTLEELSSLWPRLDDEHRIWLLELTGILAR